MERTIETLSRQQRRWVARANAKKRSEFNPTPRANRHTRRMLACAAGVEAWKRANKDAVRRAAAKAQREACDAVYRSELPGGRYEFAVNVACDAAERRAA